MLAFLATVSASVLEWGLDKLASFIYLFVKEHKTHSEALTEADQTQKQVEDAKTPDQKSAAARSVSSDLVK